MLAAEPPGAGSVPPLPRALRPPQLREPGARGRPGSRPPPQTLQGRSPLGPSRLVGQGRGGGDTAAGQPRALHAPPASGTGDPSLPRAARPGAQDRGTREGGDRGTGTPHPGLTPPPRTSRWRTGKWGAVPTAPNLVLVAPQGTLSPRGGRRPRPAQPLPGFAPGLPATCPGPSPAPARLRVARSPHRPGRGGGGAGTEAESGHRASQCQRRHPGRLRGPLRPCSPWTGPCPDSGGLRWKEHFWMQSVRF